MPESTMTPAKRATTFKERHTMETTEDHRKKERKKEKINRKKDRRKTIHIHNQEK